MTPPPTKARVLSVIFYAYSPPATAPFCLPFCLQPATLGIRKALVLLAHGHDVGHLFKWTGASSSGTRAKEESFRRTGRRVLRVFEQQQVQKVQVRH